MAKVSKADVHLYWSNVINNAYHADRGLKEKFYVVEPEIGKRAVLKRCDNMVVQYVDPQAVVNAILRLSAEAGSDVYPIIHRDAVEIVKLWMGVTAPIEMPRYLGERNDGELCFHRLTFNYKDNIGDTIVLDELMSRCTNAPAVRQYIGSLTVENSSRFQYLWIYGSGGEGKGSFGRALVSIFGSGCVTMSVPRTDGQKQFLAYSLQGKRICIFPECSNFSFPNDPLFKQMTGGDNVWFEQKGKMGHSGKLHIKFIFFSNERPGIQGTDANMRRIIYSEISKPSVKYSSTVYDALIAAEMPHFIIKCRREYLEKCPQNEEIEFNDEVTKGMIDANEEQFEVLTEKWFVADSNSSVMPSRLQEIKSLENMDGLTYRKWIEYMRLKLGIQSLGKRLTPTSRAKSRVWSGVRELTDVEKASWIVQKNSTHSMGT